MQRTQGPPNPLTQVTTTQRKHLHKDRQIHTRVLASENCICTNADASEEVGLDIDIYERSLSKLSDKYRSPDPWDLAPRHSDAIHIGSTFSSRETMSLNFDPT